MIRAHKLTARPLTARRLTAYKLGQQSSSFDPIRLFRANEEGTFLDFTTSQVYADTAGTDPAEVGEGIAFVDDKSPNDTDSTQVTSTARPIFGRVPRGGRRNLLTYTEEFDNAYWPKTRASITADATTAPDGTTTADALVEDASNNSHFIRITGLSAATRTLSVYAKPVGRSWLLLFTNSGGSVGTWFDVTSGVVGTSEHADAGIESAGDGWYRVWVTATGQIEVGFSLASGDGNRSYAGDGTSGIYLWGAQLEVAA